MGIADFQEYLKLIPMVNRTPQHAVWLTFDAEADAHSTGGCIGRYATTPFWHQGQDSNLHPTV